jgi:hypothetical protein
MNTRCTCEKRHPCTSTVQRQLTDWREQVTTWRDLHGLLYNHSDIVCLLIQSNCIELRPSINILIWAAWLFDHPVAPLLDEEKQFRRERRSVGTERRMWLHNCLRNRKTEGEFCTLLLELADDEFKFTQCFRMSIICSKRFKWIHWKRIPHLGKKFYHKNIAVCLR